MSTDPPVDPRGPRFSAGVTTVLLAVVLLTGWWPLLAVQAVIFAASAFVSLRLNTWGQLYRVLVAPRLPSTSEREDSRPLRFAQGVGFVFAALGVLGYATGVTGLGIVATAFALIAALLNAAFGLCLGCEAYLLLQRFVGTSSTATTGE